MVAPPPEDSCFQIHSNFNSALKPWDAGARVKELQILLNACGHRVRVDGEFGQPTEVAVKTFQRQHGLQINGIVCAETWAALEANIQVGTRRLKQGHSGSDVRGLQELLHVHGAPIAIHGNFDGETERAVILFQQQHGLQPIGVVDAATWERLRSCPLSAKPKTPQQETIHLGQWW